MQTVEKIGETPQTQMILSARTSESLVTAPVLENSPVVVGSEQPAHVAEYMMLEPMVSEIRDLKSDLVHIRELLGVLVRKERSAEAKAEIAARRLNRMERERGPRKRGRVRSDPGGGPSRSLKGREGDC